MIKIKKIKGRGIINLEYDNHLKTHKKHTVYKPYYKLTAEQEKWKLVGTLIERHNDKSVFKYSSKCGKVLITAEHDRNLKSCSEVLNYVIFKNESQSNKFKFKKVLNKEQGDLKFDAYCKLMSASFSNVAMSKKLNYVESYAYAA